MSTDPRPPSPCVWVNDGSGPFWGKGAFGPLPKYWHFASTTCRQRLQLAGRVYLWCTVSTDPRPPSPCVWVNDGSGPFWGKGAFGPLPKYWHFASTTCRQRLQLAGRVYLWCTVSTDPRLPSPCVWVNDGSGPFWGKGAFGPLPKYWHFASTTCRQRLQLAGRVYLWCTVSTDPRPPSPCVWVNDGSGPFWGKGAFGPLPKYWHFASTTCRQRLQLAGRVYLWCTVSTDPRPPGVCTALCGRQCLQTTDRNSYDPRVNGRGIRVNGVAFGVKCAYSCILGAFGPRPGATRPARGVLRTPRGGGPNRGGGARALIYHIHIYIYYYTPLPLNLANKQQATTRLRAVLAIAPSQRFGSFAHVAILEPRWWPCQIQVLSQKLTGGGPGRVRQVGRCPPKSVQLWAKNSLFSPKIALVRVQNSQTKANGRYTARAA